MAVVPPSVRAAVDALLAGREGFPNIKAVRNKV
jgi:hypothetical protein